jgi:antitoxin (DNA-binding transcriptional repressor) of toxin-antitoxin stability system
LAEFVTVEELATSAAAVVDRVARQGDHVVVTDGIRRLAIIAPHGGPLVDRRLDKAELGYDPEAGSAGTPSGRETLLQELREAGLPLARTEQVLDLVYSAVLELCQEKEEVFLEDLRALAEEAIAEAPSRYRLLTLTTQTTTGMPATAEVTLQTESGPAMRRQSGDGPLDAAFKAIEKLTGLAPKVESFAAYSASPGRDALAEALIELSLGEERVTGRGASTDSVAAGVHAYLHALNFLKVGAVQPG